MKSKTTQRIKVGIVGGSGYVAGELLRCLINHPNTEIDFVYSHSHSDKKISEIHTDLFHSDLVFSQKVNPQIDVVFLCLGHGNSTRFLLENQFSETTKIIDLSNDFRLNKDKSLKVKSIKNEEKELEFTYGLPEIYAQKIKKSNYIANPGCFATAIQLGTLPLTKHFPTIKEWHVHALTGSTGAGQSLLETTHFSWRSENVLIYKPFSHQHLGEIEQSLKDISQNFEGKINFIPLRGNFTRGIFASMYVTLESDNSDENKSEEEIISIYQNFYKDAPFVKISNKPIDLKQVVNTNYCLLHIQKIENKILITSCIHNLLKGAAGQAIENMNLQFDFPQETGLAFKANYF